MKMEASWTSEMMVSCHKTTWHHSSDLDLKHYHHENLKTHI